MIVEKCKRINLIFLEIKSAINHELEMDKKV